MYFVPEHAWILTVLVFRCEQLLCAVEQENAVSINIILVSGIRKRHEIWMHTYSTNPPFPKVVVEESKSDQVEHRLEARAIKRHLNCLVSLAGMAVYDSHVSDVTENRLTELGLPIERANELRLHLLPRDRIRRQVSTQDPEEVLVVTRLRQVVLWACWHGDEVAPKILFAVRVFGLREQTPRRDVLARRRQTITSKASTVHCFWLTSEYTDRYITDSKNPSVCKIYLFWQRVAGTARQAITKIEIARVTKFQTRVITLVIGFHPWSPADLTRDSRSESILRALSIDEHLRRASRIASSGRRISFWSGKNIFIK